MSPIALGVLLTAAGGIASLAFRGRAAGIVAALFAAAGSSVLLPVAAGIITGARTAELTVRLGEPFGLTFLAADPLSALFLIIISAGGTLGAIYSIGYMADESKHRRGPIASYNLFYSLLSTSMLVVVLARSALLFLFAWEIMSFASYFLVTFDRKKRAARDAGLYYLAAMQLGAGFLIAGFAWGSAAAEGGTFAEIAGFATAHPGAAQGIFLLLFLGFGLKAGLAPLHSWLPRAHPEAPTGVSALMSGVMTKTGLYGILRFVLAFRGALPEEAGFLIFGVGLFSAVYGIINVAAQRDLKQLLAYSTVENIGICGMAIGLGVIGQSAGNEPIAAAGYLAGLLHIFNHFTFKTLLFHGAGAVYKSTGVRDLEKLGGLAQSMPVTAAFFLVGSLAISAMPLLSGFTGEFALYLGLARGVGAGSLGISLAALAGFAGLAFVGAAAVLGFTRAYGIVFLGTSRGAAAAKDSGSHAAFALPMALSALLVLLVGLAPTLVLRFFFPIVGELVPAIRIDSGAWPVLMHAFREMSIGAGSFALITLFFLLLRTLLLRRRRVIRVKTWDCGFQPASSRVQYSATSYSSLFIDLVSWLVPRHTRSTQLSAIFPGRSQFVTESGDLIDRLLVDPLHHLLRRFLSLFRWIQSGHTQQYILYGLAFLLLLLVLIIGIAI